MVKYIIKRLLLSLFILLGVSLIIYILIRMMPLSYFETQFLPQLNSGVMTQEEFNRILALYGLDDNSFFGILKGYWGWLTAFVQGDFGTSFQYGEKVEVIIRDNMGISFGISFVSLLLEIVIAIPLGIKCACNQYGKIDYTATVLCMVGMAFPTFFLGNLMIKWFAVDLGWFETGGLVSAALPKDAGALTRFFDMLWHLVLPIFVMVVLSIGGLMRYTRTNTLEVLNADYIRTARAKGLSERKVI